MKFTDKKKQNIFEVMCELFTKQFTDFSASHSGILWDGKKFYCGSTKSINSNSIVIVEFNYIFTKKNPICQDLLKWLDSINLKSIEKK